MTYFKKGQDDRADSFQVFYQEDSVFIKDFGKDLVDRNLMASFPAVARKERLVADLNGLVFSTQLDGGENVVVTQCEGYND